MKTIYAGLLLVLVLCGCRAPMVPAHGVVHFAVVDAPLGIYRGGQPSSNGWTYLSSMGVSNVVKLNEESEGVDAVQAGRMIHYRPISWPEQVFGPVSVAGAVGAIQPGTFIHCLHGQDRTGLVVAMWRVRAQRWSCARAEAEMLAQGFHQELHGLWECWEDFKHQHATAKLQRNTKHQTSNSRVRAPARHRVRELMRTKVRAPELN